MSTEPRTVEVKVKRLRQQARLPSYAKPGDACLDLYAHIVDGAGNPEGYRLRRLGPILVPTGIAIEIPPGYEGQIRPRSGNSARGLHVSLGTIDSEYRGELRVSVWTSNTEDGVRHGDRIAQLAIRRAPEVRLIEAGALSETERGCGGFGHTGK